MMTLKEKVEFICKYLPGDIPDIAAMIPCHYHTLNKMRRGEENVLPTIKARVDVLFQKAKAVQEITESV